MKILLSEIMNQKNLTIRQVSILTGVPKEYTPPNEHEMMECIKIVAQKTVEEWIK